MFNIIIPTQEEHAISGLLHAKLVMPLIVQHAQAVTTVLVLYVTAAFTNKAAHVIQNHIYHIAQVLITPELSIVIIAVRVITTITLLVFLAHV